MSPLHVPSFGGGVVLVGSPDVQKTDELGLADSYDIGPRGQLVVGSAASDYTTIPDKQPSPVALSAIYGLTSIVEDNIPYVFAVGLGKDVAAVDQFYTAVAARTGEPATLSATLVTVFNGPQPTPPVEGTLVTVVQLPGVFPITAGLRGAVLVNLGAREGYTPKSNGGMYTAFFTPGAGKTSLAPTLTSTDSLGTSAGGEFAGGNKSKRLYFRGIAAYNNFVFGWGFDNADATNGDGPNRVMFSNLGNPLKWGNDNQLAVGVNRDFTDSDAIVLGDAGEIIRGALKWNGKLYFGTNSQLHYIAGYGRDSFIADGSNPVAKSYNIVGPFALIEGPDRRMYGVSDQGLWSTGDAINFEPLFQNLVGFDGHSNGYWDLIWNDPTLASGYPGRTNQDLVWMAVDWERFQVLVGIPFCNATTGSGIGTDTVVIKYHPRTGGFTRQVFLGTNYTAASYVRRAGQQRESRIMGTGTTGKVTLQRYGYQVTPTTSPAMPTVLPSVSFGPYAPFGPDGEGVVRRLYLVLAWESAASLPIVFTVVTETDESTVNSNTLTISSTAPGSPVAGDLWLDTSQSNTSIGNASSGATVAATGGFLTFTWSGSAWRLVPGGGAQGTRVTIPIPITRRVGVRRTVTATCTSAAGRFQIEGLGLDPGAGAPNA